MFQSYLEEHSPYLVTCLLLLPKASVFTVEPHSGHGTVNAVAADFTLSCFVTSSFLGSSRPFIVIGQSPRARAGGR